MTVRFEPEMYRVTESSSSVSLQLVLSGETSNRVAVTIHSFDREAIGIIFLCILWERDTNIFNKFNLLHSPG